MEGEQWIVMGDFNSVELPEDTHGSSNLLNGAELRACKELSRHTEIADVFFLTLDRKGPRYTRQKIRVDRMEFARLDRMYVTDGADWLEQVIDLTHDGKSGLSDHYPVVTGLQWVGEGTQNEQWRTYFKFHHQEMQSIEVKGKIAEAWRVKPVNVSDARIHWDLGWSRVKRVMQGVRRENRYSEDEGNNLTEKLKSAREMISSNNTQENRTALAGLEAHVKEIEIKNAMAWRLTMAKRWLREGDAPSHYFFAMMKSKFKREKIESLTTEDGEVITDQGDILKETHKFYQTLFRNEPAGDANQQDNLTQKSLQLVKKQVNQEDNLMLGLKPDLEELEKIVNMLPGDKAPGLDRVTSEVVRENWDIIKEDCTTVIDAFWTDGKLTRKTKKSVVKLIPKTEDRSKLKDWRPISLAVITYNIVKDMGLLLDASEENWRNATTVIPKFETILGAKLNVTKSLEIPIGFQEPP
ncbi:hypothetical protein R1sor_004115 [Riccia sorocarpa]|uniref:Endonuclease/exonuclease/phosphatase domain-containing protein n=1 Tax=Riccia sorocarpa TaxID=122646 RepID=A0ABD3H498_9MARC